MMMRRVIPIALVTIITSFILFANLPPIPCLDPAGCILLQPGETLLIGIPRVNSGTGIEKSLEIQQSAELALRQFSASKSIPTLSIQSFFAACLPGSENGASVETASTNRVIMIFDPGCGEEATDFKILMDRTAKTGFSPTLFYPNVGSGSNESLFFSMAQQAANIVASKRYQIILVASSPDNHSTNFQDLFCKALKKQEINCQFDIQGNTPEQIRPDAKIFISLAGETLPSTGNLQSTTELPAYLISLSRPQILGDPSLDVPFWIGPSSWAGSEFLTRYLQAYQTVPESLEARITYESMPGIIKSLQETSRLILGGIWIIPRQAFGQSLDRNMESFSRFVMQDCSSAQPDCILTPFSLFHLNGNDYKLDKS